MLLYSGFSIVAMEVHLVLMCSGILLSLSSVTCVDSDMQSDFDDEDDKAIEYLRPSGSTVLNLQNTFHFSQMEQIPKPDKDITTPIEDTANLWSTINDRLNYQRDQNELTEVKIDSLMQRVTRMENMLIALDKKFSRVLEKSDVGNDWSTIEELATSRRTTEELKSVAGTDDSPLRIDNESPRRRLQDNIPNYELNDNEITGLSRKNFDFTNPTESKSQKSTDRYENSFTTSISNEATTNSETSKRTYRAMKKDTIRVSLEPDLFNCDELQIPQNGIYKFGSQTEEANEGERFYYERYCDFATPDRVAWTVIQRRFANNHQLSFNKTWSEYKLGFGDLDSEFWFGNDFIHRLTSERDLRLRIIFEDDKGRTDWAEYSLFKMKSEEDQYELVIGGYRGTLNDRFQYFNGQAFSTFDRTVSCAAETGHGWWFKNCEESVPGSWLGSTSMKMMVRPKRVFYGK